MSGFAVINREEKINGTMDYFKMPYVKTRYFFSYVQSDNINVPSKLEKIKLKYILKSNRYKYYFSRDYNLNINRKFELSVLSRAFDIFTIKNGCDIRLNEVVITDAAEDEALEIFVQIAPIARRIILHTQDKEKVKPYVEWAYLNYGISTSLVSDINSSLDRADATIVVGNLQYIKDVLKIKRPTMIINSNIYPTHSLWFRDVKLKHQETYDLDMIYAQGYLKCIDKKMNYINVEQEGFYIEKFLR
ncbi:MAG: hypothetical protein N2594_01760 [Clostridiales bacterium]|nr:hypothetical protein [Clostridiales bacterium]